MASKCTSMYGCTKLEEIGVELEVEQSDVSHLLPACPQGMKYRCVLITFQEQQF